MLLIPLPSIPVTPHNLASNTHPEPRSWSATLLQRKQDTDLPYRQDFLWTV